MIFLGVIVCPLCAGLYYARVTGGLPGLSPHVERAVNKDSDWHRKWFESSLLSLQREGDSVVAVYGRRWEELFLPGAMEIQQAVDHVGACAAWKC